MRHRPLGPLAPILALLVVTGAACGSRTAPRLPSSVRPPERRNVPASAAAVVDTALDLRGTPYVYRGTDRSGFDCSGFVQYVFAQNGIALPRSVREQHLEGIEVSREELAPGDLVFFSTTGPGATHVGIVVDDDLFVHAPSGRGVVRVERISGPYWSARFAGGRRVVVERSGVGGGRRGRRG